MNLVIRISEKYKRNLLLKLISQVIIITALLFLIYGCGDEYYEDQKVGITIKKLGSDLDKRWALEGVIVDSVKPGSSADGLIRAGELISYIIDERRVKDEKSFKNSLGDALKENKKAILRISKTISISSIDDLGVNIKPDPEERGVFVAEVNPTGKAQKSGIKINTIIYTINDRPIKNINDYNSILSEELKKSQNITVNIARTIVAPKLSKVGIGDVENGDGGVIVKKLEKIEIEGSPASMEGINEGDMITHVIDEMKVNDIKSYKKAIKKAIDADRVIFRRGELGGIKLTIVNALGNIGDTKAVEPLLKSLNSNDRWIRRAAANALKGMDDPRIIQPLMGHILEANEPDPEVRKSAIEAMAILKPIEAIEPLAQALRDSSLGVRLLAGTALGRIGESSIDVLLQARHDSDSKVRDIAVATLGKIVGKDGRIPPVVKNELKSVLADEKEESTVKLTAVQALYKIGDLESIAELRKTSASKDPALSAFINELLLKEPAKM
ncbi:MAG: HEAT repeat domain-containing protein [bacterium]